MHILVVGGAGYVGSHTAQVLLDRGYHVTVLDNLSTGHKASIAQGADFIHCDLNDKAATYDAVAQKKWDGVMHFAALSLVGISVQQPWHYLRYNTLSSLNLIEACVKNNIKRFVFSSTAALFGGEERTTPIPDDALIDPGSPYGESKFFIERSLRWADRLYGMRSACLRYFNAAGSDHKGRLGEDHHPETHLIPLTIDAMLGNRGPLKLFGNDYPTHDGTCIRDYIHVEDLADAHIRVLDLLNEKSVTYNLGNGKGFSNLEIIESIERVSGKKVPWIWAPRRAGDPAVLVADSTRIQKDTGWKPHYTHIDDIIKTTINWRADHPHGYEDAKA